MKKRIDKKILGLVVIAGCLVFSIVYHLIHSCNEAASIGIIGGADGPTAIYVTTKMAPRTGIAAVLLVVVILLAIFSFHKKRH